MSDLILCNINELPKRIHSMKQFIFKEIKEMEGKSKPEKLAKLRALIPFWRAYSKSIRLGSPELKENVEIIFEEGDLLLLVEIYLSFYEDQKIQRRVKEFLLLHLYPPSPFINKSVDPFPFFKSHLIKESTENLKLALLGSLLASTDAQCAEYIVSNKFYLTELTSSIPEDMTRAQMLFQFWINCSAYPQLKDILGGQGIAFKIYEGLKKVEGEATDQILRKGITEEVLALAIELIKLLVSGRGELEEEMAKILLNDLEVLSSKRDFNFVNNVLVPCLRMELTVPICIYPYDSDTKKWISIKKHKPPVKKVQSNFFLPSNVLNIKQKNAFLKVFKKQLSLTNSYKKVSSVPWTQIFNSEGVVPIEVTSFWKMWESIQNQSPCIFIVSGTIDNDKPCLIGGYSSTSIPSVPPNPEPDFNVSISYAEDNFLFYYEEDECKHFKFNQGESFGNLFVDYDQSGVLSIANDFALISYSMDYSTAIGEVYQIECMEDPAFTTLNTSFKSTNFEVWSCKLTKSPAGTQPGIVQTNKPNAIVNFGSNNSKISPCEHPWHKKMYPYNSFRLNPVFNVPVVVTANQLASAIFESKIQFLSRCEKLNIGTDMSLEDLWGMVKGAKHNVNGILDLEYDIHEVLDNEGEAISNMKTETIEENVSGYMPRMGVFEHFEKLGGVKQMITVTLKSLNLWKNQDLAKKWILWLQELETFSAIPIFFKLFIKNKSCKDLLFKVLAGLPEEETNSGEKKEKEAKQNMWEKEQQSAVRFSYQILAEVFQVATDPNIRELAVENGLIHRILERLQALTGEIKRRIGEEEEEEGGDVMEIPTPKKEEEGKEEEKSGEKKAVKNIDKSKRKGVGYTTNVGEVWKVQQYLDAKKLKNDQIKILVDILSSFFYTKEWSPKKQLQELIYTSCLLPLLENALRSGSLLEMTKDFTLYISYFGNILFILFHRSHRGHQSEA